MLPYTAEWSFSNFSLNSGWLTAVLDLHTSIVIVFDFLMFQVTTLYCLEYPLYFLTQYLNLQALILFNHVIGIFLLLFCLH